MDESFLHYIWKFQYFYKQELLTSTGLPINIIRPGIHNLDAGPDFSNAKVIVGDIEWNGNVEIHVHEGDWYTHQHERDEAYNNVILHVVWDSKSTTTRRSDGTAIPVLELKHRVDLSLIENYNRLVSSDGSIPCSSFINKVDRLKIFETLDKAVVRRLQNKSDEILIRLRRNQNDWEETCFQLLSSNFGFKINKAQFLDLAEKIPYKIILKHADNLIQVEAILFGMAGFLDGKSGDNYQLLLKKEFNFLHAKYQFDKTLSRHNWKFLRLRPPNFPTIRLAQLAKLMTSHQKLFSMFLGVSDIKVLKENLRALQSEYWQQHYDFGKKSEKLFGGLGKDSINNIIINTCAPLLAAYSIEKDEREYMDRALVFLQNIAPEKNKIVNEWKGLGLRISSAFDSQACIELMNNYCAKKKCLECNIGSTVIQTN